RRELRGPDHRPPRKCAELPRKPRGPAAVPPGYEAPFLLRSALQQRGAVFLVLHPLWLLGPLLLAPACCPRWHTRPGPQICQSVDHRAPAVGVSEGLPPF